MKRMFAIPFVSALIGGGVVVAVIAATSGLGERTERTVTELQPAPLAPSNSNKGSAGLTPHEIYVRAAPGVVFITSTIVRQSESPFGFGREGEERGQATGSGIVIDGKGTILTNWHVVENAVKVTVSFENNQTVDAQVVGKDPSNDLALLHVSAEGNKLHPIPLGDSSKAQVGDPVLAIGNPFGFARTLTTGVVSALQRQITAPNGFTIANVIQTDAPINPGNSGGPLLNSAGEVIGINSQIESGNSGGSVGIGFAVPINTAKAQLSQLKKGGTVRGAYLGVSTRTIDASLAPLNLPVKSGTLVESVQAGTPAQRAGLKAGGLNVEISGGSVSVGGDIIVSIDGKAIASSEDLAADIAARKPGDKVSLGIWRQKSGGGYERKTVEVTLGTQPNSIPNPSTPNG